MAMLTSQVGAVAAKAPREMWGQYKSFTVRDLLIIGFFHRWSILLAALVPLIVGLFAAFETKVSYTASGLLIVLVNREYSGAQNVTDILLQQGKVPLTRMLAPGAMGESEQVSTDKSAESEAQNRRVVVRVLQNKAIAGV